MRYARLGTSGLKVSRIALGCMSYGDPERGWHSWVLDEQAAGPFFRQAVELGITLWDTANVYAGGSSEEVVGRAMRTYSRREDIVLATKVRGEMHPGPGGSGLSRKAILEQVDASLTRLGTDYIDLYQIHAFDPEVPVEETMEALHDVVRAGKARYLGASGMAAWQFAEHQHVAARHGWTTFASMQHPYNLMYREDERELLPLIADQGVGSMAWSPLARGKLTRPWGTSTARSETDTMTARMFNDDNDKAVTDALQQVAEARDTPMAQIALAWVLSNPNVTAPIVGATRTGHLADAVTALDIDLAAEETATLENAYRPHRPMFS